MHICIVGGGFTGLTAGYRLAVQGHRVTVIEQAPAVGGLAAGWKEPGWTWSLEKSYHHFFTNDDALIGLMRELSVPYRVYRPVTSTYVEGAMRQLDSPQSLLSFTPLPVVDRIRTGMTIAACKLDPFWQPLERTTASSLFRRLGGDRGWDLIWGPLMTGKFGPYADRIAASWLWARLNKRTMSLGYPDTGFQAVAEALQTGIVDHGGTVGTNTGVTGITGSQASGFSVTTRMMTSGKGTRIRADRILLTVPSSVAARLVPFPDAYRRRLSSIPHLTAQMLVLETTRPLLDRVYWLNINDRSFPFLAMVAHTNLIDRARYGGRHITYLGNYLPADHPYLRMDARRLLAEFLPFVTRLSPGFTPDHITGSHLHVAPMAQPIHEVNYSARAPGPATPVPGVYLTNLDSIYPWDRGTNYAVDMGNRAATLISASS